MSALAMWLRRWQPIAIHSAILAGAHPEVVAGWLGDTVKATFDCWHEWTLRQRDFIIAGKPSITTEEFDKIAQRFVSVRCIPVV